jgi:poly-beta-1,6-N-acetyl-D-glucosamine synthase
MALVFWISLGLVAYLYLGYWGLLCLLACCRRSAPAEPLDSLPRVSLIIPAHNEERTLHEKLTNALQDVRYPRELLEIIVASDGSTDGTVGIAREFEPQGVRIVEATEWRGKASVVNEAVDLATGDIICLCDANVMFEPEALARLVARLGDRSIGAVSGDVRLDSDASNFGTGESLYYRLERAIQRAESRVGSLMGVDGGMYVLRRELYRTLPVDTVLDDFVISMNVIRQNRRIAYEPMAVAHENGTPLSRQEFRRRMRVSAGAAQALKRGNSPSWKQPIEVWQFVSHKLLRWLGVIWLILLMAASALLVRTHWIYATALGVQLGFYGLSFAALISVGFRRTRIGGIPFYFTMSHVAMFAGLIRGLINRQAPTWIPASRVSLKSTVT